MGRVRGSCTGAGREETVQALTAVRVLLLEFLS